MALDFLDPVTLFFVIGLAGGILKGDLRLPDAVYQLISIYLLLAIGLKGGIELSAASLGQLGGPAAGTLAGLLLSGGRRLDGLGGVAGPRRISRGLGATPVDRRGRLSVA